MIELDELQRQELSGPEPRAVDPQTNRTYVIVSEEVYQRIKGLIDEEWDDDALRADQLERSAEANGWNEPKMDACGLAAIVLSVLITQIGFAGMSYLLIVLAG